MSLPVIWQYMDRSVTKKDYMDLRSFAGPYNIFFWWRTGPYTAIWPSVPWTICYICTCMCGYRWFSPGTRVSTTNKTDRHDIAEILLKVALNTITLNPIHKWHCFVFGGDLFFYISIYHWIPLEKCWNLYVDNYYTKFITNDTNS